MIDLYRVARLLATPPVDEPAPASAWDAYMAACERAQQVPADTHDAAALHCFVLALGQRHTELGVTIAWLLRTGRLPQPERPLEG